MNYKVNIRGTDLSETIEAKNDLDAKTKFCEKRGFLYRLFANKLDVKEQKPAKR